MQYKLHCVKKIHYVFHHTKKIRKFGIRNDTTYSLRRAIHFSCGVIYRQ